MRLLGVARVVRAVLRRWIGGLVSVDDVHFGLRSGALELVNVELSDSKAEAALLRLGVRGARVISARAALISVSLPLIWRRGARVRLDVDGVCIVLDTRQSDDGAASSKEAAEARAKTVAARLDAEDLQYLFSGADRPRNHDDGGDGTSLNAAPRVTERYWRRAARCVQGQASVRLMIVAAQARC